MPSITKGRETKIITTTRSMLERIFTKKRSKAISIETIQFLINNCHAFFMASPTCSFSLTTKIVAYFTKKLRTAANGTKTKKVNITWPVCKAALSTPLRKTIINGRLIIKVATKRITFIKILSKNTGQNLCVPIRKASVNSPLLFFSALFIQKTMAACETIDSQIKKTIAIRITTKNNTTQKSKAKNKEDKLDDNLLKLKVLMKSLKPSKKTP